MLSWGGPSILFGLILIQSRTRIGPSLSTLPLLSSFCTNFLSISSFPYWCALFFVPSKANTVSIIHIRLLCWAFLSASFRLTLKFAYVLQSEPGIIPNIVCVSRCDQLNCTVRSTIPDLQYSLNVLASIPFQLSYSFSRAGTSFILYIRTPGLLLHHWQYHCTTYTLSLLLSCLLFCFDRWAK